MGRVNRHATLFWKIRQHIFVCQAECLIVLRHANQKGQWTNPALDAGNYFLQRQPCQAQYPVLTIGQRTRFGDLFAERIQDIIGKEGTDEWLEGLIEPREFLEAGHPGAGIGRGLNSIQSQGRHHTASCNDDTRGPQRPATAGSACLVSKVTSSMRSIFLSQVCLHRHTRHSRFSSGSMSTVSRAGRWWVVSPSIRIEISSVTCGILNASRPLE